MTLVALHGDLDLRVSPTVQEYSVIATLNYSSLVYGEPISSGIDTLFEEACEFPFTIELRLH